MNRSRIKKILLIMTILLLLVNSCSSLHMGKGEIYKYVSWDNGDPIIQARVGLDIDGDETVDVESFVDSNGIAHFQNIPYGTCYIYVDIDNDGIWETAEEVIVDGIEYVDNVYSSPPEMWRL